eukprot:14415804-Alexandrium_andersonii.AAC.1
MVRQTGDNGDVPLICPPAGRTGGGSDRVDPGLDLGTDGLPSGLLEAADRRGRPAARSTFIVFEPRRRKGAAQVGGGRHDRLFAKEATCPRSAPLASPCRGDNGGLDPARALGAERTDMERLAGRAQDAADHDPGGTRDFGNAKSSEIRSVD